MRKLKLKLCQVRELLNILIQEPPALPELGASAGTGTDLADQVRTSSECR